MGNNKEYVFYDNENIVPYIFMSIIVALFLGLTVSAEEIFRDRKILKRDSRSGGLVVDLSGVVRSRRDAVELVEADVE